MSDPKAAALAAEPDARVVIPAPTPQGHATNGVTRALGAFAVDAVLALAILLAGSVLGGALWAFGRVVRSAANGRAVDIARDLNPDGLAVLIIAATATASAALVLYFWRRRASRAERLASLHKAMQTRTWCWAAASGVAAYLMSGIVSWCATALGQPLQPSNLGVLTNVAQRQPWLLLGFAVLIAPAYEELLFRRVLFGRLWAAGRPLLGAVLSAVLFALLHEVPRAGVPLRDTVLLWIDYGVMGLLFAWVYRRTGTLWAAIGAHGLNNLLAGLVLLLGSGA